MVQVDADLVCASGVEMAENEGSLCRGIGGQGFVIGDSGLAARWIDDGHFLAVYRVATDVGKDGFTVGLRDAIGDGEVKFLHGGALGELGDKTLVRGVGFRDDEAAGGVFVEAVDDAGAFDSADAGQLAVTMVKERVDESAVRIAGGGVYDHAVCFVEDDDVIVLEKDIQGYVLRGGDVWDCLGNYDAHRISGFYAVAWLGWLAIDENVLLANESLDARAGKVCQA